jgi:hypothetical protein
MNRYSLIFAALMVASLSVPSSQSGDKAPADVTQKSRIGLHTALNRDLQDATDFIDAFEKAPELASAAQRSSGVKPTKPAPSNIKVLLATVPHPVETHLAEEFDDNVDAIQDGLQDAGYEFDSAWIPWTIHSERDTYDDDEKEKSAKKDENKLPGILLFRKGIATKDAYDFGLVVFLIAETPTQGIALKEIEKLQSIMTTEGLKFSSPICIMGPTFSGSYPSLVRMVNELAKNGDRVTDFLIRSGGTTVSAYAKKAASEMAQSNATVNLGSALYDGSAWTKAATDSLNTMGIELDQVAILAESESVFGNEGGQVSSAPSRIYFPRDISSLRADYEKQGILDAYSVVEPWKRTLTIKSDEANEGDTVKSFGGTDTDASNESILIGISEFIKAHDIRAVLVSATNEKDRVFLTQFIHARNSGVRVVVLGSTRLFMRSSTAQFSGDLVADVFPMLPRLDSWTSHRPCQSCPQTLASRIFPNVVSQGTYFATLDLTMQPQGPQDPGSGATKDTYPWVPEYSAPAWSNSNDFSTARLRPPVFVAALGGSSTWPLAEVNEPRLDAGDCENCKKVGDDANKGWQVHMPFTLFAYGIAHCFAKPPSAPSTSPPLDAASTWKALLLAMLAIASWYCFCFRCADPAKYSLCASFAPLPEWRYWFCRVVVPGLVFASGFQIMALTLDMPRALSNDAYLWWAGAELLAVAAPLAIAACALRSAHRRQLDPGPGDYEFLPKIPWQIACFVPPVLASATGLILHALCSPYPGSILNKYREMHWESGLSLVPTALIFLLAILIWTQQAGQGLAILELAPPLPGVEDNGKITNQRSEYMAELGRPLTAADDTKALWVAWSLAVAILFGILLIFKQFRDITTLEAYPITVALLCLGGLVAALIALDLLQFVWLWNRLNGVLRSLNRKTFKRSFAPGQDFSWRALWSFSGASLRDRRRIIALQTDCAEALAETTEFASLKTDEVARLLAMRATCNQVPLKVKDKEYKQNRKDLGALMTGIGTKVYSWYKDLEKNRLEPQPANSNQPVMICRCKDSEDRFADERAEVAALDPALRGAENFLCHLYIGFIMTMIARLHSLLLSIAAMFSLAALGIAIYPFTPIAPLIGGGLCLLAAIAIAFYEVFSGLDTDPIMARIVNGDERKLQWSFFEKFAESMAFPLLTLASTFLPGGASRLLGLVRILFNHGN